MREPDELGTRREIPPARRVHRVQVGTSGRIALPAPSAAKRLGRIDRKMKGVIERKRVKAWASRTRNGDGPDPKGRT